VVMVTVEDLLQQTVPTGKRRSVRSSLNDSLNTTASSTVASAGSQEPGHVSAPAAGQRPASPKQQASERVQTAGRWRIGSVFKRLFQRAAHRPAVPQPSAESPANPDEGPILRRYSEITRELLNNWVESDAPELAPPNDKLGEERVEEDSTLGVDHNLPPSERSYRRRVSRRRRFIRAMTCGIDPNPEDGDAEPTPQLYAFRNQELPAVKPLFLPWFVALILLVLGVACLGIGIYLSVTNNSLRRSIQVRYDDKCSLNEQDCVVQVNVPERLTAPVYVWYHLTNFYSNHRIYDESRSARMDEGHWPLTYSQVRDCLPKLYGGNVTANNPNGYLVPCGLIQYSQFNDTIHLCSSPDVSASSCTVLSGNDWTDVGVAWESDINALYHNGTVDPPFTPAVNARITSPDYIVWQRISSGSNFLRLYRIINRDLEPGRYSLKIANNFNSYAYRGSKYVNIGKVAVYGMRNTVLQIAYLTTAGVLLVLAPVVMVTYWLSNRRIADPNSRFLKQIMDEIDDAAWIGEAPESANSSAL
jgi:hypothetical protein